MRKPLNTNKGLSTVVATVLMILVVMIGMTILFAFVNVYASNFQAGSGSAVLESMTIEDVWIKNPVQETTPMQLWIYNVGKIDFRINSIYVNGAPVTMYDSNGVKIDPNVLVKVNMHMQIDISPPKANAYSIKIVTARGSAFEGTYSPTS
jgi:FlaG/FlaF family flagellin (archaellin)